MPVFVKLLASRRFSLLPSFVNLSDNEI